MIINGEKTEFSVGSTIGDLLNSRGYVLARVAVEINGRIIPKETFDYEKLAEGDKIEIVSFVGGG